MNLLGFKIARVITYVNGNNVIRRSLWHHQNRSEQVAHFLVHSHVEINNLWSKQNQSKTKSKFLSILKSLKITSIDTCLFKNINWKWTQYNIKNTIKLFALNRMCCVSITHCVAQNPEKGTSNCRLWMLSLCHCH